MQLAGPTKCLHSMHACLYPFVRVVWLSSYIYRDIITWIVITLGKVWDEMLKLFGTGIWIREILFPMIIDVTSI